MKDRIHFASGTAVDLPVDEAVDTLVDQINAQFPEEEEPVLDLALVFLSAHFTHEARQVAETAGLSAAPCPPGMYGRRGHRARA